MITEEVIKVEKPKGVEHDPICPYCENEIPYLNLHRWTAKVFVIKEMGAIGAFSCPHCKRFLGVASVFWGKE